MFLNVVRCVGFRYEFECPLSTFLVNELREQHADFEHGLFPFFFPGELRKERAEQMLRDVFE